jgi:segregation and condensation protein A
MGETRKTARPGLDSLDDWGDQPPPRTTNEPVQLMLALDVYDGPIDVLLSLAREQKVDLGRINVLALAEQYLNYVEQVRTLKLELAADYLVMAAWLTYLKSGLLLPAPPPVDAEDEPTPQALAAAFAWRLRQLEAIRGVVDLLRTAPRLGSNWFRCASHDTAAPVKVHYTARLYDLLKAYGQVQRRGQGHGYKIASSGLMSVEQALERVRLMLGKIAGWCPFADLLPAAPGTSLISRAAVASTLLASLELARAGEIELEQIGAFGPIRVRAGKDHAVLA